MVYREYFHLDGQIDLLLWYTRDFKNKSKKLNMQKMFSWSCSCNLKKRFLTLQKECSISILREGYLGKISRIQMSIYPLSSFISPVVWRGFLQSSWIYCHQASGILTDWSDALGNLVSLVQSKKCEKHPWWSFIFIKFAGFSLQLYLK